MELLIVMFSIGILIFAIGFWVIFETKFDTFFGYLLVIVGVIFLVITTFSGAPQEIPVGLPARTINVGEYKVAFVYVAGENVNLGIEKSWDDAEDSPQRLYLYQFPKSAFDGSSLNHQAKKLMVVESGEFRKLVLE